MQDDQIVVLKLGQRLLAKAEIHLVVVVEHTAQGAQVGMRRIGHAQQFVFLVEHLDKDMAHIIQQLFLLGDAVHLNVDGQHALLGGIKHEVNLL